MNLKLWNKACRIWRNLTPEERADILDKRQFQHRNFSAISNIDQHRFMDSVKEIDL